MTIKQMVERGCSMAHISKAKIAERLGTSRSAFCQRLQTGRFRIDELETIAESMGAKLVFRFEFPDGRCI